MTEKPFSPYSIIGQFSRIVKQWQDLESKPRKFGIEEDLFRTEIHLIEAIGVGRDVSVTDLAKEVGVTKGAVSQTLKKLDEKGLVVKEPDPMNSSRLLVSLTAKGKIAFYAHEHWHELMDGGFKEYFTSLPEAKLQFLNGFLTEVEEFLNKF